MSDLPLGWAASEIGAICTLNNGRAFKPTEWSETGLPIVRIQNLNNSAASFNYYRGDVGEKYHLKGGELLFAWSGTPGTSFGAHVWRGGEAVLNQHIFRVDFDADSFDKRFFKHAINQTLDKLIDIAHGGVGLRHVTKGKFEGTVISVPPLPEQRRIADKLDATLARVDACRDRLARITPLLKRFRQSVLAAATSGRLTADWCEQHVGSAELGSTTDAGSNGGHCTSQLTAVLLGEYCNVLGGKRLPKGFELTDENTGYPYIRVTDFADFSIKVKQLRFVPAAAAREISRYIITSNDVFISIAGSIGLVGQVPEEFSGSNLTENAARIVVKDGFFPKYLMYQLAAPQLQAQMHEKKIATTQDKLGLFRIKELELCKPSLAEQHEIVRRVETLFAFADRLEARLATAQTAADRLTPALLAKAFRGELVPQDPNDEPASALLQRLAAQRAAEPKAKRGRKAAG